MLLEGMYLPLLTPFTLDGALSLDRLARNVARYSKTPAAGLVALSRWGQPSLLTAQEQRDLLKTAAEATASTRVLIAGVDHDSVSAALDTIEFAAIHSYDVAMLRPPASTEGDETRRLREAVLYCTAIADRSPLPILLTSGTQPATALDDDALVTLAAHPNIVGVVLDEQVTIPGSDAQAADTAATIRTRIAGVIARTAHIRREAIVTQVFAPVTRRMQAANLQADQSQPQLISAASLAGGAAATVTKETSPVPQPFKTRTKTIGFQVLSGSTANMLTALEAGAAGVLPGFSAGAPQACYEVVAAWKDGDPGLAAEKQNRIHPMATGIEQPLGVSGIKYAAELTGYFGGRPRLPGLALTVEERTTIETLMQSIRN